MNAVELLRMEQIKMRRRSASNIAFAVFVGFTILMIGSRAYLARTLENAPRFELPTALGEIHTIVGPFVLFFSFITVVNLTAAEYQWRTARQNVIDGLSREQLFLSKLLLVAVVPLLFFISGYGIGIGIAALGGGGGGLGGAAVLKAVLGTIVTATGYSSMALLASFATRNAAGAIAIVLGYITIGEALLELVLRRGGDAVAVMTAYLPGNVFKAVSSIRQYAPDMPALRAEEHLATPILLGIAVVYIFGFSAAAYAIVRRQDL